MIFFAGNIELKNLKIRKDALTDFNLPIQVIFGHLGKLILKVPWTNLYSQAVHATVEDLYVLVGPKYDVKYDAEKEEALEMAAKKSALRAIDDALQKEYDGGKLIYHLFHILLIIHMNTLSISNVIYGNRISSD